MLGTSNIVEVGKGLAVSFRASSDVSGNTSTVTISGTYGIFVDDTYKAGSYTESKPGTVTGTVSATATIKAGTDEAQPILNSTIYPAKEGTNTLTITASGISAVPAPFTAKTVYASTNTKAKVSGTYKNVVTNKYVTKSLSNKRIVNVTAYYPIYTNGVTSSTTDTTPPTVTATADSTKLPLVGNNTTFGVAFAAQVAGGTGYRILLQAGKTIKSAMGLNGLTSKYDLNYLSKFVKNPTAITKATGDTTATYYAWEYKGTEGANRVNFTIG